MDKYSVHFDNLIIGHKSLRMKALWPFDFGARKVELVMLRKIKRPVSCFVEAQTYLLLCEQKDSYNVGEEEER